MAYAQWTGWKDSTKQVANAPGFAIIKEKPEIKPVTLILSDLKGLEKWQNDYYAINSGMEFTKAANPNISKYSGGAYSAINIVERGGVAYEKALKCYGDLGQYQQVSDGVSDKTAPQSAVSAYGSGENSSREDGGPDGCGGFGTTLMFSQVNWLVAGSTAFLTGVLSLLMIAGLPEVE